MRRFIVGLYQYGAFATFDMRTLDTKLFNLKDWFSFGEFSEVLEVINAELKLQNVLSIVLHNIQPPTLKHDVVTETAKHGVDVVFVDVHLADMAFSLRYLMLRESNVVLQFVQGRLFVWKVQHGTFELLDGTGTFSEMLPVPAEEVTHAYFCESTKAAAWFAAQYPDIAASTSLRHSGAKERALSLLWHGRVHYGLADGFALPEISLLHRIKATETASQ